MGAEDEVEPAVGVVGDVGQVALFVADVAGGPVLGGVGEHGCGDVHGEDFVEVPGEQGGVLAGAAAEVHRTAAVAGQQVGEVVGQWAAGQSQEPVERRR
jgi:hypothetical protein